MKFSKNYFFIGILVLLIEILIALYVRDNFVRPYLGDFLVVILIYSTIKAFFKLSVSKAALFTLLFSYFIEFLQYLQLVKLLGWEKHKFAVVVLGTSFSWEDILAYTAGIIFVIIVERIFSKRKFRKKLAAK